MARCVGEVEAEMVSESSPGDVCRAVAVVQSGSAYTPLAGPLRVRTYRSGLPYVGVTVMVSASATAASKV